MKEAANWGGLTSYLGECSPGELNHSSMLAAISTARASIRRASRSILGGNCSAFSLANRASLISHSSSTGKVYGPDLCSAGQTPEGQITEVSHIFPRPGADKTPVPKVSSVTKAGDLGCGVGHYK